MRSDILEFYKAQIEDDFVPYWKKFEDSENGGILNCINNYGDKKISDNKFIWSQGRYLFILGKLYELEKNKLLENINSKHIRAHMDKTYNFISKYGIYDDKCCYLVDYKGNKLIDEKTGRYYASIFADCFAVIGMAQYANIIESREAALEAYRLYKSVVKRIGENNYLTEPYPIPDGYKVHSIPMILINTTYEIIRMLKKIGFDFEDEIQFGLSQIDTIMTVFYDDGLIREHVSTSENYETRLLDRHINPGHTLEDLWFIIEFLKDYDDVEPYLEKIIYIAKKTFDLGWDKEYGGLLRFVDKEGGVPKGEYNGSDYEKLILDTNDMKLWWPHSEILYLFLFLYELSGDEEMMTYYEKASNYVFDTFPNKEIGEWIQIRKRDGSPEDKLVALPVKDPFHILRNYIKIVELGK